MVAADYPLRLRLKKWHTRIQQNGVDDSVYVIAGMLTSQTIICAADYPLRPGLER